MHADYDRIISGILSGQSDKELVTLTQMLGKTRRAVEDTYDGLDDAGSTTIGRP